MTVSGGRSRSTFSPAGIDSRRCSRASAGEIAGRHAQLQADHQALAAHFLDDAWDARRRGRRASAWRGGRAARRFRGSRAPAPRRARRWRSAMASGLPPKVVPWTPATRPRAASAVARQAATGKPPPRPLAEVRMSGAMPDKLIGEQLACAPDAGLHLVEDQQQAMPVADLAQAPQEGRARRGARRPRPGSARSGSPPSPASIAASTAARSVIGIWSKPSTFGPKPSRYLGCPPAAMVRQRPAVERALEGQDAKALGMAVDDNGAAAPS